MKTTECGIACERKKGKGGKGEGEEGGRRKSECGRWKKEIKVIICVEGGRRKSK